MSHRAELSAHTRCLRVVSGGPGSSPSTRALKMSDKQRRAHRECGNLLALWTPTIYRTMRARDARNCLHSPGPVFWGEPQVEDPDDTTNPSISKG